MEKNIRIFIVEDALFLQQALCRILQGAGLKIVGAACRGGKETFLRIKNLSPDVALIDLALPGQNGTFLIESLNRICPEVKVIVCSGILQNEKALFKSEVAGALHFIHKPFGSSSILDKIHSVMEWEEPTLMAA